MKIKHILIIITTIIISWLIPNLLHKITDKPADNFFVYYSSIEKSFCTANFDNTTNMQIRLNTNTGQKYSRNEFDSILPLFYYKQLLSEGKMPDSISGTPISIKDLNTKVFFFRYIPIEKNSPKIQLHTLFESMSERINLEIPEDMFRITKQIEFINPETNKVNKEKSKIFNNELIEHNFNFPPKLIAGNPSARKKYDEGYFIVDKQNKLFHLKMQKGKPFVKIITKHDSIKLAYISTLEPNDRSFYAFLFDKNGYIYLLSSDNYKIQPLPINPINLETQNVRIMANPMYWNIIVTDKNKKHIYAINSKTKHLTDTHAFILEPTSAKLLSYMFPYELEFKHKNSLYISPLIKTNYKQAIILNILLAILFIIIFPHKKYKYSAFAPIFILITGIFGFISEILFIKN